MNRKKVILITGVSLLLMQKLIKKIDTKKYHVKGLLYNTVEKPIENIQYINGNILNKNLIDSITEDADIIIHSAGATHSAEPAIYYKINTVGTMNLVDSVKNKPETLFVYISSRSAENKCGHYGLSKLKAEKYIMQNLEKWLIIKLGVILGTGKNVGIDRLISNIRRNRFVFVPGGLKSKIYPILIEDAVNIMYDMVFIKNIINKNILLTGKKGYRYMDFVRMVTKTAHGKRYIITIPKFIIYMLKYILDIVRQDIGFVADQIPRLYGQKKVKFLNYTVNDISDYIKKDVM